MVRVIFWHNHMINFSELNAFMCGCVVGGILTSGIFDGSSIYFILAAINTFTASPLGIGLTVGLFLPYIKSMVTTFPYFSVLLSTILFVAFIPSKNLLASHKL